MKIAIMFTLICAGLFGQQKQTKQPGAVVELPPIQARDSPSEAPTFARKYLVRLTSKPQLTLSVACEDHRYLDGRECSGAVMQSDEKYVNFTVSDTGRYTGSGDTVAEHIFDPVIVPELKTLSRRIAGMDAQYRASWPYQFVDKSGQVWVKAPAQK